MINTVLKSIKVLELLGKEPNLGVTDISEALMIPKSSAHGILKTLQNEGLVTRNELSGKFYLGVKLIELGNLAQKNLDICKIAAPFLNGLNKQFDETVHLTVLDNDEVLYIDCIESKKRLRTYSVIGVRAPLYCTAVGKAILAFLPESEIKRIIMEKGLEKITENTITTEERMFEEIKKIRLQGYAIDDMEHEDFRCIGAPIRDAHGDVFASISLSGPAERNTMEKLIEISQFLIDATDNISKRLGYSIK